VLVRDTHRQTSSAENKGPSGFAIGPTVNKLSTPPYRIMGQKQDVYIWAVCCWSRPK